MEQRTMIKLFARFLKENNMYITKITKHVELNNKDYLSWAHNAFYYTNEISLVYYLEYIIKWVSIVVDIHVRNNISANDTNILYLNSYITFLKQNVKKYKIDLSVKSKMVFFKTLKNYYSNFKQ